MKTIQIAAALTLGLLLGAGTAHAQAKAQFTQDKNAATLGEAFKGLGSSSKDPIQIDADNLEIKDKENMAIFTGNVTVRQKDTTMKTQTLRVLFEPKAEGEASAAPGGNQKIRRYEADNRIVITNKDQKVSGDAGWFDLTTNTAQINRNVVILQAGNEARGARLDIDLKTGVYKLAGTVTITFETSGDGGLGVMKKN